jgi:cytochrome P450
MTELTMDVVGAALFGHEFGHVARQMSSVVTSGLRGAEQAARVTLVVGPPRWVARTVASSIHHAPWLPKRLARLQWVMRTVDEAVWSLVNERRATPSETGDLLNLLLSAEDEHGKLPLRRVRDEVTTFMLAGYETTANALTWLWWLLDLNPEARDRMLAEIDALGDRPLGVEDLPQLRWTTACFQEGMRLMPPAWSIPRTAITTDVIDGYRITKGSTVIIPVHAIHHDARFWPEPETFDPTRFLDPERVKARHRSAYLPFGGGKRICIGTSFALMEATLIVAMMSRRFTFELKPGHPVEPEATLTLRPRYGMKMIAHARQTQPAAVAA